MARKKYDDNGAELVAGSAAEQLHDEQKAKALQQANAPLQTGVTNYWGGTTSDQSRAQDDAVRQADLKRIDELHKTRDAATLSRENHERLIAAETAKGDREEARQANDLKIAELRWGADGALGGGSRGSRGSRSSSKPTDGKPTDKDLMGWSFDYAKANPGTPGQPGLTPEQVLRRAKNMRDGTPAEQAALKRDMVKATEASQAPAAVSAPSALNTKDWNAYGENYTNQQKQAGRTDVQAPMKFEGLQPGMQNDQIGRFTKADGSVHFANAGAVRNVAPAPVVTPMASTVGRDANLRSAPAPAALSIVPTALTASHAKYAPTPTVIDPAVAASGAAFGITPLADVPASEPSMGPIAAEALQNAQQRRVVMPNTPDPVTEASGAAFGITPSAGVSEPSMGPVAANAMRAHALAPTTVTRPNVADSAAAHAPATVSAHGPTPAPVAPQKSFLSGLNEPSTSTNPLFPNYDNPAQINPLATPQGFMKWYEEKSGRRMPTKRDANPRRDTFFNIPKSSTNPLFPNYAQ